MRIILELNKFSKNCLLSLSMDHEIQSLIAEITSELKLKENYLEDNQKLNSELQVVIFNLKRQIKNLEIAGIEILKNYPDRHDMLVNFKKRAAEIKKEFDHLGE